MAFAGKIASIETYGTGMIVVGDTGNINVEIENQGSDRFKVMAMYAYNGATLPETGWEAYRIVQLERGITVYPGESSMNTYIYTMCDPGIEQGRWCTAYLHVRCEVFPEGGASYEAWLPARAIARPVLDMRYLPKVESFSAARTPPEDSAQVAVNVRCSLADGADAALRSLIAAGPVADVTVEEPSMESILERIYTSHGGDAKCASTAPSREST